jgi:hypothetical protein
MYPLTAAGSPNGPATGCQANASAYGVSASGIVDAYAVNLLLDHAILENIIPDSAPVGSTVALQGSHFHLPVTVLFACQGTETSTMALPTIWPREAGVKVPSGLPQGFCDVGIQQGDCRIRSAPDLGMVVQ